VGWSSLILYSIFAPCGGACKSFGGKLNAVQNPAHFWRKIQRSTLRQTNTPSPRNNKSPCLCVRGSYPTTGPPGKENGAEPYSSAGPRGFVQG